MPGKESLELSPLSQSFGWRDSTAAAETTSTRSYRCMKCFSGLSFAPLPSEVCTPQQRAECAALCVADPHPVCTAALYCMSWSHHKWIGARSCFNLSDTPFERIVFSVGNHALPHIVTEGVAAVLLQYSAGTRAFKTAFLASGAWGMVTFGMGYFFPCEWMQALWESALVLFYCALWLLPTETLYRRPALIPYARFWALLNSGFLTSRILKHQGYEFAGKSDPPACQHWKIINYRCWQCACSVYLGSSSLLLCLWSPGMHFGWTLNSGKAARRSARINMLPLCSTVRWSAHM